MSDEADLARLRSALEGAQAALAQAERRNAAEQRAREMAEADVRALRDAILSYVTAATYGERARFMAELYALATMERPGMKGEKG